jgi:filamentous hemagglutinin family protein
MKTIFTIFASLAIVMLLAHGASAARGVKPTQVASGTAIFNQNGSNLTITASNGAIINYAQFDILSGSSVQFVQPTAASTVLNRITSAEPSHIDGSLTANGIVYLVNPAGVIFGHNSVVNVGSLYAAAANLSDQDFAGGNNRFAQASGNVVNNGTITAGGSADLIGLNVVNGGTIIVHGGDVALVAGSTVYLGNRDGGMMVKVEQAAADPSADLSAGDIYSIPIRQGTVSNSGSIDVSSQTAKGGKVDLSGESVALSGNVNALGANGKDGTLTLDPHDITIAAGGSAGLSDVDSFSDTSDQTIDASVIDGANANVVLQANTDINVNESIAMTQSGVSLTMQAGRSVNFASGVSITTTNGAVSISANDNGAMLSDRDSGLGGIAMDATNSISTGTGAITLSVGTLSDSGSLNVGSLTTSNAVNLTNTGGAVTIAGQIDANSLNVTGTQINLAVASGTAVTTGQAQDYSGPVNLMDDTTLASTSGGDITFESTVDGGANLTVNSTGVINFDGLVGSETPLTSLTTGAGALDAFINAPGTEAIPSVTVTASQTYDGPVVLDSNTVLASQGTSSGGGAVTFSSTVDGAYALTLYADEGGGNKGSVIFDGLVGDTVPLASLAVNTMQTGAGAFIIDPQTDVMFNAPGSAFAPSITTTGDQTYVAYVEVGATTQLTTTAGGNVLFWLSVTGVGSSPTSLAVNTSYTESATGNGGNIELPNGGGFLGEPDPLTNLASLTTTADGGLSGLPGTTYLNGGTIQTTGNQTYNNPVIVAGPTAIEATEGGNVAFNSTVNGSGLVQNALVSSGPTLSIDTSYTYTGPGALANASGGNISFGDFGQNYVGASSPLGSLTTTANPVGTGSYGKTIFSMSDANEPTVTTEKTSYTTGDQTYNNPVVFLTDGYLSTAGNYSIQTGSISLLSTVDAPNLTLSTNNSGTGGAGNIQFGNGGAAYVGSLANLGSLTVNATAAGASDGITIFDIAGSANPSVLTTGGQTYNSRVYLSQNTSLQSSAGGAITFDSTVNGQSALAVSTSGTASFAASVGDGVALTSVNVAAGAIQIAGDVESSGQQTYTGPVTLLGTTQDISGGGAGIDFTSTIAGADSAVSVTTTNLTISSDANLNSLAVTANGNIDVNSIETYGTLSLQSSTGLVQGANGPTDLRPDGLIELNGDLTSSYGDIALAPSGLPDVPSVATIVAPQNLTIMGKNFSVGQNEKITVQGNLDINVGRGVATLGDVNTAGNLNVTAKRVVVLLRPSGTDVDEAGTLSHLRGKDGVDFISLGGALNFHGAAISLHGVGQAPKFATSTGTAPIPGYSIFLFPTKNPDVLLGPDGLVLDLQAESGQLPLFLAQSLPRIWDLPPLTEAFPTEFYFPYGSENLQGSFDQMNSLAPGTQPGTQP